MTQDPTRERAIDPTTQAAELAEIATYRPDLRPLVAVHPQAYPELLAWLRGLGDPAVVAAIDARAAAAWSPAAPVVDVPQPYVSQSPPYASQAQPYDSQAQGVQGFPAAGGFVPDGAAHGDPSYVAFAGDEIPTEPRRRRRGLVVAGAAAGTALVLGGAAFAVNHFVLDKLDGSETPRAAFDQLVAGLEKKDALAMLGAMSPAEVSSLSSLLDETLASAEGDTTSAANIKAFTDILDSLTIATSGVTTTESALQAGLSKVEVTAGTITVDGDPEKLADAFVALSEQILAENAQLSQSFGLAGSEDFDVSTMRAEIVTQLDEALPATGNFADFASEGDPFFVVTVEEKGAWYVSPYLSVGEMIYVANGTTTPRGTMLGDGKGTGFDSPVAAGDGLVRALLSGDVDALVAALPLPERRALSVYLPAGQTYSATATVTGSFTATDVARGRSLLRPSSLAISVPGENASVTIDGACLTVVDQSTDKSGRICLDEAPLLRDLGLDKIGLVAVEENGSWFVSPTETLVDAARSTSEATRALAEAGRLSDTAWLEEQTKALAEHLAAQPLFADMSAELTDALQQSGGLGLLGAGIPGLVGTGTSVDDGTGTDLFGYDDARADVDDELVVELDSAYAALAVSLFSSEDLGERDLSDGGASILAGAGYTPVDGFDVSIVALDMEALTFCIAAQDTADPSSTGSIDATGMVHATLSCS